MSYNRQLSPGGRRIQNPGRASDGGLNDPYRYERHNSYTTSPRSSGGVIPISTETFVNNPPPPSTRVDQRYDTYSGRPTDTYSGRPRRSSLVDTARGSAPNVNQLPSARRPTIVQSQHGRPTSPPKGTHGTRDKEYYSTSATSKEPQKREHKKLYSVNDGTANLVADVNVPAGGERHHKRRDSESFDRGGVYRGGASTDRDRRGRSYHLNGPARPKEKSIEDEDAYSYTDAAGMFRDTEPRWREREQRPRRNSIDRSGGGSRERPTSMLDPYNDPRRTSKDIGPPPSTRGWDKLNENLGRSRSVRESSRDIPQSPNRARVPHSPNRAMGPTSPTRGRYNSDAAPYDPYYVAPRTVDDRRWAPAYQDRGAEQYDRYDYDDRREPRRHERRNSMTRVPDHSVERRGFGIRQDVRSNSRDRYGKASDESVEMQNKYRDSAYAVMEPHRRETAPELNYHEEQRLEQEKRDRMAAEQERERQRDREAREMELRRRDEEQRAYNNRDYDRERDQRRDREREYDVDRERERERERMMQPHEQDRHHHRHGSNRDHDYYRKDDGYRDSNEIVSQPGLSTAAAGGIAGAAAAYGLTKTFSKEDRDKDRERGRDLEPDRRHEQPRDYERERVSPRPQELRPPQDPYPQETHSDDNVPYQPERPHHRPADDERGLGFAFEGPPPEPPRSAPPVRDRPEPNVNRDKVTERESERSQDDRPPVDLQPPATDADDDYRRRLEQAQRDLGRGPEERHSDSDPDRERRRREREQRQRHRVDMRDMRNGESSVTGTASTYTDSTASYQVPGAYDNDTVDGTNSTVSRPGLHRKPSILDQPLMDEPAQIIDNSMSERRENRVRIVDPPTEEEERKPKGILKKPTEKFPEHSNTVREGVAPLKDAKNSGIPPGARWTKIDRRLVNPEALEDAKERFEERMDCVIVLRVLTKEEIQKLADRTRKIRDERYEEEREERKAAKRRERNHDRHERDEYELEDSEDEFKPRAPKMLEAPSSTAGASSSDQADFIRENKDRRRERESEREYMSGGLGRKDDYSDYSRS